MLRGADLTFLSMLPTAANMLFPPLTFVQDVPGKKQETEFKNSDGEHTLTIVEVTALLAGL